MKIDWKTCFRVGLSIFVLFLCIYYWSAVSSFLGLLLHALSPLLVGLVIAYVLNILMSFYEKRYFPQKAGVPAVEKTRRPVCLIAAILTLLLVILLIVWLVVPELVSCVRFLISEIPPAVEKLLKSEFVASILPSDILARLSGIDWAAYASKAIQVLLSGIGDAAGVLFSAVSSVVSALSTAFISIIFSIYLLLARDRLQRQCRRVLSCLLRPRWFEALYYRLGVFNDCFRRYIVGQCTEAVILGVLCVVGMLIFRFPYAGMIGALVGFTALIPIVGAFIGAGVGAFMILTRSPFQALLFIVFIVVLQQLEGNLIYPRVVGKSIGLPALWVLAAVTVGGSLLGIAGMLIGVPITAAVYRLFREAVQRREALAAASESPSAPDAPPEPPAEAE
ncbi:MAG: AI-2E family transporter [Oscillospiraceae bacterium]